MMSDHRVMPRLVPAGQWYRRVAKPFVAIAQWHTPGGFMRASSWRTEWSEPCESLEATLMAWHDSFGKDTLGHLERRYAILDRDGWIVYGMNADADTIAKLGHPSWMGCEQGFACLEMLGLVDPVELAIRESIARRGSDEYGWWKDGT